MMTAVMVDARRPGLSGWTKVRHPKRVQVSGVGGGRVVLHLDVFLDVETVEVTEDTIITLEERVLRVKAELKEAGEFTRLSVDLIGA